MKSGLDAFSGAYDRNPDAMISYTYQRLRARAADFVHTSRMRRHLRQDYGIVGTSEYRRFQWHHGARYYEAVHEATALPLFVKHGWSEMVANEVLAWHRMFEHGGAAYLAQLVAHEQVGEFPFVAFERIQGEPLTECLERCDVSALRNVARQLIPIVDALHAAEVVHRDIRPDNLLIRAGTVVIIDFALAVVPGGASLDESLSSELEGLGAGFNPAPMRWDDAYSAHAILMCIEAAIGFRLEESEPLRARIGRRVHVTKGV